MSPNSNTIWLCIVVETPLLTWLCVRIEPSPLLVLCIFPVKKVMNKFIYVIYIAILDTTWYCKNIKHEYKIIISIIKVSIIFIVVIVLFINFIWFIHFLNIIHRDVKMGSNLWATWVTRVWAELSWKKYSF